MKCRSLNYVREYGLILLSVAACKVGAAPYEWNPEFKSLGEGDVSIIESPQQVEAEYASDLLSFNRPLGEEWRWLNSPIALDMTLGSVSAKHFMIDHRAKVRAALNDAVEFRFTWFDEGDFEERSTHVIPELVFKPWRHLGFSLYGEPALYKRQDDTGTALLIWPSDHHEIRLFHTWVDVTRLKRNDQQDTYIEPDLPYVRGIVSRWWSDKNSGEKSFFEIAARWETKTRWIFPNEQFEYRYWKGFGSAFLGLPLRTDLTLFLRGQWDRRLELKLPYGAGSTVRSEGYRRDRSFTLARLRWEPWGEGGRYALQAGLEWEHRRWEGDGGTVLQKNVLPHAQVELPAFGVGETEDRVWLGYDFTWHEGEGPVAIRHEFDRDESVDHRLNAAYEWKFKNPASLVLMATFDLDKLDRRIWQGGAGQFRLYF